MTDRKIVTFLDADGNEVSNDPEWIAKQEILKFEDTVQEPEVTVTSQGVEALSYKDHDANWLKDEVKRRREAGRTIDTTGVKKKSQLVALLEADDEAKEEEDLADLNGGDEDSKNGDDDNKDAGDPAGSEE